MGMRDDLRRAQAANLRSQINKLRTQASVEGQIANEAQFRREILEAVGILQDQMEEVMERLDRLDPDSA